jgi:DnaJ-class molecular chaperone
MAQYDKNANIVTGTETETVDCHWCGGEGIDIGVAADGSRYDAPCPYCKGLGRLTVRRKSKYVITGDGDMAPV